MTRVDVIGPPGLRLCRRAVVKGGAASALVKSLGVPVGAPKLAALNWALSETLYAMRIVPICAAEVPGYEDVVRSPATPRGVVDVGLQSEPNVELLASLAPDVCLIQSWQGGIRPLLEKVARVEVFTLFARGGDPWQRAVEATMRLGALASQPRAASTFLSQLDTSMLECRARLAAYDGRPLYVVQSLTDQDLVVFARGSLFDTALRRLGLENAWTRSPDLLWGSTRISVEALTQNLEARIVIIASPQGVDARRLFRSRLWQSLPQVQAGRVAHLPLIWGFGALPTAQHFEHALVEELSPRTPS